MAKLPFEPFAFRGYVGKRGVLSYGLHYDFSLRRLGDAPPPPGFLKSLVERAAGLLRLSSHEIRHVLVTEYASGAGIGWHRDRKEFGEIVAFSFVSSCSLRFRRKAEATWCRASLLVEPGSAYVMSGPARHEWQHSIAPSDRLRYSVTLRTIAHPQAASENRESW
jgi:alkylated DNA repair dioxygenase AlkB